MGDDAFAHLFVGQARESVESAAGLEGAYALVVLALEEQIDLGAGRGLALKWRALQVILGLRSGGEVGEGGAGEDWSEVDVVLNLLVRCGDRLSRERRALGDVSHCLQRRGQECGRADSLSDGAMLGGGLTFGRAAAPPRPLATARDAGHPSRVQTTDSSTPTQDNKSSPHTGGFDAFRIGMFPELTPLCRGGR